MRRIGAARPSVDATYAIHDIPAGDDFAIAVPDVETAKGSIPRFCGGSRPSR